MRTLNLGCGNRPLEGAINHDRTLFAPYVDCAHDLDDRPWPWEPESFDRIHAESVVEHLDDFIGFFNECWRLLRLGGTVLIVVPRWDHINVAIDPTHKRGYHPQSFHFLDPETEWGRKAHMYTPYRWQILKLEDLVSDVRVELRVRKP